MEQSRSQLPFLGDSLKPSAEQSRSADDPIAALERVSKDLSSALILLRKLRNLAKDLTTNAAKIRVLLPRMKPALAKLPVEITAKVERWVESLSKMLDDEEAQLARSFASDLDQLLCTKNVKLSGNMPLTGCKFC